MKMNNKRTKELKGKYVSVKYNEDGSFILELWNGQVLNPFMDLDLDEGNIDVENIKQAQKYVVYANAYALALLQKYEAEMEVDVFSAQLDADVREQLKDRGEKVTETLIKRYILSHPNYAELEKKLNTYNAIAVLLKELLNAFEHKREALFHFSSSGRMVMRVHLDRLKERSQSVSEEVEF